ncbi:MAG: CDP-alcohol phosphatidyltransferase family protein [Hyphomicrobiaceae bacterium]
MTAPNIVSLLRILLVPLAIWLIIADRTQAAFFVFVTAGVSDAVDGFMAKRFGLQSELGAYLDPLADKLLLVSIYVALGVLGDLPSWLVILVVSRDVLIVAALMISFMLGHPLRIRPLMISKLNTAVQIGLAAATLADSGFVLGLGTLVQGLVYLTALLTGLSAAAYLRAWLTHMAGGGEGAA